MDNDDALSLVSGLLRTCPSCSHFRGVPADWPSRPSASAHFSRPDLERHLRKNPFPRAPTFQPRDCLERSWHTNRAGVKQIPDDRRAESLPERADLACTAGFHGSR
jgi:hypothetical protein